MPLTSASERFEAALVVALMVPLYFLAQLGKTHCDPTQVAAPSVLIARVGWPCEATNLQKLMLVLRNLPLAVWDELHQPGAQRFISANFVCLFVRALAAHILPASFHEQVLAPALVYFTRVSSLAGLLLMGPTAEPSSISLAFFSDHIATDVLQVLLFLTLPGAWNVDARVELAACLLEAACALTCLSWHGAKVPGGPPHPAALLAGRALVPLVNLGLAYAVGRWRPAALSGRNAFDTQTGRLGKRKCQSKATDSPKGGAKDDEGISCALPARTDTQVQTASGSVVSGSTAALQQLVRWPGRMEEDAVHASPQASLQRTQEVAAVSPQAQPPYRAFLWGARQAQQLAGAATELDRAALGVRDTGVSPSAGRHGGNSPRQPQPPYRAFVRHVTTHYKIPWAEPEDIAPGFEERLAALSATRGRVLTGVYVRAGCIELTLTLADPAGRNGDTPMRIDADQLLSYEELVAALGLSMSPPMAVQSAAEGLCFGTAPAVAPAPLQKQVIVHHAAGRLQGHDNCYSLRARVVELSPHVLLLPPHIATGAAAASVPVLRLRVAFGGGSGPAAADVVVRGSGGYLAVRVAAKQLSAAEDAAGEAGAAPAQEWEYAIQLVEPPPHPQLLTVQLAFPAAATAAAGGGDTHHTPVQWLSVPVLAVDDSAVAAELGAALQQLQQQDTSSACMEELVCDLGQWLASASGAGKDTESKGAGCRFSAGWVSELGAHLLQYAEGEGLVATAARIRAGASQLGMGPKAGADISGAAEPMPLTSAGAVLSTASCPAADEARLWDITKALCWRGARRSGRKHGSTDDAGCSNEGLEKGKRCNNRRSARSGLQEYMEAWIVTMCKTCQMVECLVALSFAALGLKANQPLWSAESAVVYAGLGMGTVTTLAGLWMAPRAWSRLALAARVPRFLGFMTAKLLLSAGVLPPPVGAATYAGGPGILLLEGVILPSGCLLPPRTALLMSCLKLPLNLMSGLAVGAFDGPLPAALMALAVEAAALGTTLACHAYVRRRYVKLQLK